MEEEKINMPALKDTQEEEWRERERRKRKIKKKEKKSENHESDERKRKGRREKKRKRRLSDLRAGAKEKIVKSKSGKRKEERKHYI